jgi:outer membrane protein assembly factor BamB
MIRISTLLSLILLTSCLYAEDWPGWRGPRRDGTTLDSGFSLEWSKSKNIGWKVPISGRGHSSPIIWKDRIFLTSCLEETAKKNEPQDRVLICLDRATGKTIWQRTIIKAKLEQIHKLNSYSSSTPVTDGKHIFVTSFADPRMFVSCFDFEGNEVWKVSPGEFHSKHGFCSSPILYDDMVIINGDQDAVAFVVALKQTDGKEVWRADRPNRTRSYCPPIIVNAAGKPQLVLTGSKSVASYDPSSGKLIWDYDGPTEQFVASMIYHQDLFYLTAGFPTYHVMAIKPDGVGKIGKDQILWHETKGAGYVPSPVAFKDLIFLVHDDGRASSRDAKTGELKWLERLGKHHTASPVIADGRVYYVDDLGMTWVVKADAKFEILAKNDLGEEVYSSPAFVDRQIYIRTEKHLWRINP